MEQMTLRAITKAIGADYQGEDRRIPAISTDSRDVPVGCVFVALKGERFDGHLYVAEALAKGAAFAVVMEEGDYPRDGRVFKVGDTVDALLAIAGEYRRERGIKVVAVTGSVGKTTTKEMLACVVSEGFKTLKTQENLNNEIGLSQSILGITNGHTAAVLEMGMDGPGEISRLSRAAAPDIGVITNIGISHLEKLGSRENILREKLDIRVGMKDGATLILSADNDLLSTVRDDRLNIIFYGIHNKSAALRAENIKSFSTDTTFEIIYNEKRFDASIPAVGEHNVQGALAAFAVGEALGIAPERSIAAMRKYAPAGMRQRAISHAGFTVMEDCYNAAPDSMKAAIETLAGMEVKGRRILALADMLELGAIEREAHLEIGRLAAEKGIDFLFCTGRLAREYAAGAIESGMSPQAARHFPDKDSLFEELRDVLQAGDMLWVKGSRGMRLESLLERIYSRLT